MLRDGCSVPSHPSFLIHKWAVGMALFMASEINTYTDVSYSNMLCLNIQSGLHQSAKPKQTYMCVSGFSLERNRYGRSKTIILCYQIFYMGFMESVSFSCHYQCICSIFTIK